MLSNLKHNAKGGERSVSEGGRQVQALLADHDAMRAMIRSLEADPVTELDERLPAFGHLLKAHIHKEERQLFEQLECAAAAGPCPMELAHDCGRDDAAMASH